MSVPRRVRVQSPTPIGYYPLLNLKIKDKKLDQLAKKFLDNAAELFDASDLLDTAVRDVVAIGLAHLVHAGYDCQALSVNLNSEQFSQFIETKTAEWFRSRDFADWFCLGAATCFI